MVAAVVAPVMAWLSLAGTVSAADAASDEPAGGWRKRPDIFRPGRRWTRAPCARSEDHGSAIPQAGGESPGDSPEHWRPTDAISARSVRTMTHGSRSTGMAMAR